MTDPTDYEARLQATLGLLDGRCLRCKWTLAPNKREGCVPGNCAYRPGGNEQFTPAQITVRAEDLAALIAEVKRLRAALRAVLETECLADHDAEGLPCPKHIASDALQSRTP